MYATTPTEGLGGVNVDPIVIYEQALGWVSDLRFSERL